MKQRDIGGLNTAEVKFMRFTTGYGLLDHKKLRYFRTSCRHSKKEVTTV
jgi:hypothetical protein